MHKKKEKLSGLETPQTGAFLGLFLSKKERPPSEATGPKTSFSFPCNACVVKKPSTSCSPGCPFSSSPKSHFGCPTVSPRPCKVRPHVLHQPCSPCTREGLHDCAIFCSPSPRPHHSPFRQRTTPWRMALPISWLLESKNTKKANLTHDPALLT